MNKTIEYSINIIKFTSIIFAPIAFVINLLLGIFLSITSLLSVGAICVIFLVSFIISSFTIILKDTPPRFMEKYKLLTWCSLLFTTISFLLNIFVQILAVSANSNIKNLWNLYSILLIFSFSIIISLCIKYLNIKSYPLKVLIYFLIIGIYYYLLTVTIAGLATGNKLLILLGFYVLTFAIIVAITTIMKYKKSKKELDNKPYEQQF